MKKTEKVVCRPCQEQRNWEICAPNGKVLDKHYQTKEACVKAGRKCAEEYGCELCICDRDGKVQKTTKVTKKSR